MDFFGHLLPSEMPAADSQMTTSFFMLQSWMLDAGFSILEALITKTEALNKLVPSTTFRAGSEPIRLPLPFDYTQGKLPVLRASANSGQALFCSG